MPADGHTLFLMTGLRTSTGRCRILYIRRSIGKGRVVLRDWSKAAGLDTEQSPRSCDAPTMRGHSPFEMGVNALSPAHPSSREEGWIAGSSPAMTPPVAGLPHGRRADTRPVG